MVKIAKDGRSRWTDEQKRIAGEMRLAGKTRQEIADAIGKTLYAVISYLRYHNLSQSEWEMMLDRRRDQYARRVLNEEKPAQFGRPTPEMIADRDYRMSLPRTITAELCGDPALTQSAYWKKHHAGASA